MMIARIRVRIPYSSVLSLSSFGLPSSVFLSVGFTSEKPSTYFRIASISASVSEGKVFIGVLLNWLNSPTK